LITRKGIIILAVIIAFIGAAVLLRATASPTLYPKDKGLALVNKQTVTREDFREYLGANIRRTHAASALRNVQDLEAMLDGYVEETLIMQDAEKRGVFEDEDFLRAFQMGGDALLSAKFRNTKMNDILAITEEDLSRFIPPEWVQLKLRQIIARDIGEAHAALSEARAGVDFTELVRKYSIGPAAANDGDIGYKFPGSGYFSPEDDLFLFTLEKGEISPILDSPLGPAICKIEDRKAFTAEEIEEYIKGPKAMLRHEKTEDHLREIRESTGTEVYDDVLYQCVKAMHGGEKQDGLIARAGDREFFFYDLQRTLLRPYDMLFTDPSAEKLLDLYRQNLNGKISNYLLAQEARIFGVAIETEAEKADLKQFRQTVMLRVLGERIFSDITASEDEARQYFKDNQIEFNKPLLVELWQIVLDTETDAELALEKLRKDESFMRLAYEYSTDPASKRLSGYTGVLRERDLAPELAEVALTIPLGDYSDVIKTKDGYHIIMIRNRTPGETFKYEEIRGKVRRAVLRGKQEKKFAEYVQALHAGATVDVNDKALRDLFAELQKNRPTAPRPH
jgi:parvulin-like peptidyl-prolyl isomerase